MNRLVRQRVRRRPTNLSISEDVMEGVRLHGINASEVAEKALAEAVRKAQAERWREENREVIAEQNDWTRRNGVFSDGLRKF